MAKNFGLNVKLTLDTEKLQKGVNDATRDIKTAFDRVPASVNAANAAFDRLVTNARDGEQNIGAMRRELRELSRINFDSLNSTQILQVQERMAALRDEMGDTNAAIRQMSLDPFQKMASSIGTVSTLAQGVTGAMSLFGANTDGVNKFMEKTVALMGIANAAQEASIFFKETALGLELKSIANQITTNGLAATFNALASANPIGLIVTALAAAAGIMYLLVDRSDKYKQNTELIKKYSSETVDGLNAQWDALKRNVISQIDLLVAEEKITEAEGNRRKANIDLNKAYADQKKSLQGVNAELAENNIKANQIKADIEKQNNSKKSGALSGTDVNIANKNNLKAIEARNKELIQIKKNLETEIQTTLNQSKLNNQYSKNNDSKKVEKVETVKTVKTTLTDIKQLELDAAKEIENIKYEALKEGEARRKDMAAREKELMSSMFDNSFTFDEVEPAKNIMFIDPKTFAQIDNNIAILQEKLKNATPEEGIEIKLNIAKLQEDSKNLEDAMRSPVEATQDAIMSTSALMGGLGEVISGNAGSWLTWGANIIGTLGKVIPELAKMIGLNIAVGVSEQSKLMFPYNLISMAGTLASVVGLIASIPKFAGGGIVGGVSYAGDKIPALVNSGEMILNSGQQANLFKMLNGGGGQQSQTGGVVEFRLRGDMLYGAINNHLNKKNSYR